MRFTRRASLLLSTVLAVGCSSKVTQTSLNDPSKQTILECLPPHLVVINELVNFADLWRLNGGNDPADPAGLTWSEDASGTITYTIVVTGFNLSGEIKFYDSSGAQQNLSATTSTVSLSQAIDDAATFLGADAFMVGTWLITDTGGDVETGSGALTGLLGGSTNQNELEEVSTTTATPAGGPPPNADGTISITHSGDTCTMTFNTTSLLTDQQPTQEYPIGTINFTLVGPDATVTAALVFDATVIAQLTVTGISGRFDINLETLAVTFIAP